MLKRDTYHKSKFNTRDEHQGYMGLKTHSYLLKVLSISHVLQKCTENTRIGDRKSGNKFTLRLGLRCGNAYILQHSEGIRLGRKHSPLSDMKCCESMRLEIVKKECLPLVFERQVPCVSQLHAFSRAQDPPGRWPLLLEAAARDFWRRKVKVLLFVLSPVFPSFSFYII